MLAITLQGDLLAPALSVLVCVHAWEGQKLTGETQQKNVLTIPQVHAFEFEHVSN